MENKAFRLDALQEQLRHLATQPEFIAQFLHEGAYVFSDERQQAIEENLPNTDNTQSNARAEMPAQAQSMHTSPEKTKVEPATPTTATSEAVAMGKDDATSASKNWLNKVVVLLPPEPAIREVQLLHKILAASGITDEEVLVLEKLFHAKSLGQFEGSRIVLSFGAVTDFKADYQLRSKAITVIMADKLAHIEADVDAKKKLWAAMKSFFS